MKNSKSLKKKVLVILALAITMLIRWFVYTDDCNLLVVAVTSVIVYLALEVLWRLSTAVAARMARQRNI